MMQHEETTTTQTSYETSSGPSHSAGPISFHPEYLRTLPGILNIAELALCLLTIICAAVGAWGGGQGWVETVAISAFLTTLVYFIFHLVGFFGRVRGPDWGIITMIFFIVITVCFLIAAIVASAYGSRRTSIVFAAIFAWAATAVYAVDTFFHLRTWREGTTTTTSQSTEGTTTTTTTTTSRVEY